ncbi:hypothetical protein BGX28_003279 [Mortierella sp. GBA30]|nr:hypothetical protein BGX28_003279 [Mortierella sp. GBA30]
MAQFTLQRGLDDIHKLHYQKKETTSSSISLGECGQATVMDGRQRRPTTTRYDSQQDSVGESARRPHQVSKRRSTTFVESSLGAGLGSVTQASSGPMSSSSLSLSPERDQSFCPEISPQMMTSLVRPESSGSMIPPSSDGGGHDGDVEDEGGPSTVLKNPKERSINALSEKARGKLPEKGYQSQTSSFASTAAGEGSSCGPEKHDKEGAQCKRANPSTANPTRKPHLLARNSSYTSGFQGQATTARDVGLNGFIPTDEWVQGWMKSLRFEPLLIVLQRTVPKIESIHAMNDHQVLEYIRSNVVPVLLKQMLPESGRPPVVVRKFAWTDTLVVWFQGLLWSQIYVTGCGRLGRQGMGAWYETGIRLFSIRTVAPAASTLTAANAASAAAATVTDNVASAAAAAIHRMATSTFHSSSTRSPRQQSQSESGPTDSSSLQQAPGTGMVRQDSQISSSRRTSASSITEREPPLNTTSSKIHNINNNISNKSAG